MSQRVKLRRLDGSTEMVSVPTRRRESQQPVSRTVIQRVRLADGTLQEIQVVQRRSKAADDQMKRRERRQKEAAEQSPADPKPTLPQPVEAPVAKK